MKVLRDEILNIMIAGRDTVRIDHALQPHMLIDRMPTDCGNTHVRYVLSRHAP